MASFLTLFSAVFLLFQYTSGQCLPSICNGPGIIDYQQNILLPTQQNACGSVVLPQINAAPCLSAPSVSIGVPNYASPCLSAPSLSIGVPNYATQSIGVQNYATQSIGVPSLGSSSFQVISCGPNTPVGLSVISESELVGNVQINGALPFATAVIVDGNVANGGSGSINYGCGSAVNLESAGIGFCGQQQSAPVVTASLPSSIGVNIGGGWAPSVPCAGANLGGACNCGCGLW